MTMATMASMARKRYVRSAIRTLGLVVVALGLVAGSAAARPGGGHSFSGGGGHSSGGSRSSGGGSYSGGSRSSGGGSYSGGSHSSSSSSTGYSGTGYSGTGYSGGTGGGYSGGNNYSSTSYDDGGGNLLFWILSYPQFWVIAIILLVYFIRNAIRRHRNRDWDSGPPVELEQAIELTDDVSTLDPAFSQVVFEDFAFRLFSTAQRARHTADALATVAPYVSEQARAQLAARAPAGEPVVQVVVGAMRTYRVEVPSVALGDNAVPRKVRIGIEYEANLETANHTYYTVERWLFSRDANVHSKPPGASRTFPCPNCGAPWQASRTGTQVCASCGQTVDNGRFDWIVEQITLESADERPPTLTTAVAERGTDLPTYVDDNAAARWQELTAADPAITDQALEARLAMIYTTLNAAWSSNDLVPVRGMVSDGLFDYLQYWVDAYRQQGLRNVLTDMRITRNDIAKIMRDRYFDAVTIRIFATGKDYVIREPSGEHVHGSPTREREYSEYWTLIRTANRQAAPSAAPTCGNCGAPLQISRSGECEHCGAHVTSGEFDWVLSKIEQDDTYRG